MPKLLLHLDWQCSSVCKAETISRVQPQSCPWYIPGVYSVLVFPSWYGGSPVKRRVTFTRNVPSRFPSLLL